MRFIHTGGLLTKDPDSDEPYFTDWGRESRIGSTVGIADSDWAIAGPDSDLVSANPGIGTLDYTSQVFSTSASGQVTKAHFTGGTLGATYTVTNTITTNETPSRTIESSFRLLIQED